MFKNFKKYEYLILTRYCLLGIIIAVLVFQFVTMSLTDHSLRFDALWATDTFKLIIAVLISGLFSGLILMLFPQNELLEMERRNRLKNIGKSTFILGSVTAFSIGMFGGGLAKAILEMRTYDHFFASLFSPENTINNIGRICAGAVFGLFLGLGMVKQMKKMCGEENNKRLPSRIRQLAE